MNRPLTRREMDVFRLLAEGASRAQIADMLVISPRTVKKHAQGIYDKLEARNAAHAVAIGRALLWPCEYVSEEAA